MKFYKEYYNKVHTHTTETIYCLDIEVSSFWIDKNNNIIEYDSKLSDEFYNSCKKGSCVYIWQFSIENDIYYGREFNELYTFIKDVRKDITKLTDKANMIIYVHNLSYEFSFLRGLPFKWDSVFARSLRKPMKALCDTDIEFKCSYMLTHLSLASWGKQLGIDKKVGDLDYTKLRTPLTKMTRKELGYCEYDIKIMIAGLKKFRSKYETLRNIPLTSTGEVRRVVSQIYQNDYAHKWHITKLQPKTVEEWKILRACFGGGDTHANVVHVREIVENATHIDETSAYPSMIVRKKYCNTPFKKCDTDSSKWNFEKFGYIICLKMDNVELKGNLSYISKGRCKITNNTVEDNGRIVKAKTIILYCAELDYIMIKKLYKFDETIISARRSRKTYLDTKYIEYVLQLFNDKTTLKNVKGYEDLYLQQKAFLNSLYGMMVTDIVQPTILYEHNEWKAIPTIDMDVQEDINEVQKKIYRNNLAYQYGIWVTAYARYELWSAILKISDYDETTGYHNQDVVYFDTDSIFFLNGDKHAELIEELNNQIIEETIKALEYHNLDTKLFMPVTPSGKVSILGTWDYEPICQKFKTLGAKKYITMEDNELHLTCSGVPKDAVKSIKTMEEFEDGFRFTNEDCHKGLTHYLDGDNYKGYLKEGYFLNQPYGLNIRNVGYKVGLTSDFKKIIQTMRERGELKGRK